MASETTRRTKEQEIMLLKSVARALRERRVMSWDWSIYGDNPWSKAATILEEDALFLERVVS